MDRGFRGGVDRRVWLSQWPPLSAIPGLVLLLAGLIVVIRSRDRAPVPDLD